jgi:Flp pilus assembly pilin Flp
MSDLVLRSSVVTQQALESLVEHVRAAIERLTDEERGQDVVEYAGIIVIVGLIVAALMQTNIPTHIKTAVGNAIGKILP